MFLSSINWIQAWISIELNIFFFLIIFNYKNFFSKIESIIKYFIIQTFRSLGILFFINRMSNYFFIFILILIKLGFPPFHFWVVNFLKKLEYIQYWIFLTFQKIQMIFFIFFYLNLQTLLFLSFFVFYFYFLIIKTNDLKIFFFFSSYFLRIFFLLILIYSLKERVILWIIYSANLTFLIINKNLNLVNIIKINKIFTIILLISLIGFPPFNIFFIKLNLLNYTININIFLVYILLIIFVYGIAIYSKMIFYLFITKWSNINFSKKLNYFNQIVVLLILF